MGRFTDADGDVSEGEADVKAGPLFKWFGSKWQAARRYPQPIHGVIIEPYAGSAGYSLNYCDHAVTIWDADPQLAELWRWIINDALAADVLAIPVGLPVGADIRSIGLSTGQALLLKHWQRTNNVGNCWTTSPWGHLPGQWTTSTRSRVAEELGAVKHWRFTEPSWATEQPATWFIDPPYLYNYRYVRTLPAFDFGSLADNVRRIHPLSLVIACEAADKKTGALPGYLPFEASHRSVTSRRKASQSHHSNEALYVRQPQERRPR